MSPAPRTALTIAGSDSGGGAGIQADLRTFFACGVHGMTAITAVTVQNSLGVQGFTEIPPEVVSAQINAVATDIGVDAAKTGMLATAEIIREKVLLNTEQEVPHAVAVEIQEFKERSPELTYIGANIYVERDSQKGILIGKGGAMLKKISSEARADIEQVVGTRVYLEVWIKVLKNWRRDESVLKRLGYKIGK